jgi:hypothetical protein
MTTTVGNYVLVNQGIHATVVVRPFPYVCKQDYGRCNCTGRGDNNKNIEEKKMKKMTGYRRACKYVPRVIVMVGVGLMYFRRVIFLLI